MSDISLCSAVQGERLCGGCLRNPKNYPPTKAGERQSWTLPVFVGMNCGAKLPASAASTDSVP